MTETMQEVIKWVPSGSQPGHCPHCRSSNIRISENGSYGSCNVCDGNFVIRYFKPKPKQHSTSISAEGLWQKMRKAGIA